MIDLRAQFRLPSRPLVPDDYLIVIESAGRPAAIRSERALELRQVDTHDIEPQEQLLNDAGCLAAAADVVRIGAAVIVLLDADRLFPEGDVNQVPASTLKAER